MYVFLSAVKPEVIICSVTESERGMRKLFWCAVPMIFTPNPPTRRGWEMIQRWKLMRCPQVSVMYCDKETSSFSVSNIDWDVVYCWWYTITDSLFPTSASNEQHWGAVYCKTFSHLNPKCFQGSPQGEHWARDCEILALREKMLKPAKDLQTNWLTLYYELFTTVKMSNYSQLLNHITMQMNSHILWHTDHSSKWNGLLY